MFRYLSIGVSNKTEDDKYVLFLDLDKTTKEQAIEIAIDIINQFHTSTIWIIQSSTGNHHLICLDKFDYNDFLKIANTYAHKEWVKYRSISRHFVLRISGRIHPDGLVEDEPRVVAEIQSRFNEREKSNAHRLFMQKVYGLTIDKDKRFDSFTKVPVHFYQIRVEDREYEEETQLS